MHHHHLPAMHNPKYPIAIEIHFNIMGRPYNNIIKCNNFFVKETTPNTNLYILDSTNSLIHAYIHSDIVDRFYAIKKIDLRQLYEMSILINNYKFPNSTAITFVLYICKGEGKLNLPKSIVLSYREEKRNERN